MKKSPLRSLIREQIKRALREAAIEPPSDGEDTKSPSPEKSSSKNGAPEGETMSITDLGNKFLQISKDLKGSQIKGLSSGEMKALSALLDKIMTDSEAGEETNTLKRMAKL